jgi:hypothetical protein
MYVVPLTIQSTNESCNAALLCRLGVGQCCGRSRVAVSINFAIDSSPGHVGTTAGFHAGQNASRRILELSEHFLRCASAGQDRDSKEVDGGGGWSCWRSGRCNTSAAGIILVFLGSICFPTSSPPSPPSRIFALGLLHPLRYALSRRQRTNTTRAVKGQLRHQPTNQPALQLRKRNDFSSSVRCSRHPCPRPQPSALLSRNQKTPAMPDIAKIKGVGWGEDAKAAPTHFASRITVSKAHGTFSVI